MSPAHVYYSICGGSLHTLDPRLRTLYRQLLRNLFSNAISLSECRH